MADLGSENRQHLDLEGRPDEERFWVHVSCPAKNRFLSMYALHTHTGQLSEEKR